MAMLNEENKIPRLTTSNYHTWCIRAKASLIDRRLWEAISPGYTTPIPAEKIKVNERAISFLLMAVDDAYLRDINECSTAKEAWELLEEMNTRHGVLHSLQILTELLNIKKKADEPMIQYLCKIMEMHDKLKKCGYNFGDKEIALLMLKGLPEEYETMIRSFEQHEDQLTTKQIKSRLLVEEKRMIERKDKDYEKEEIKALISKTTTKTASEQGGSNCGNENKTDKPQDDVSEHERGSVRKPVRCFCCGKMGHISRHCFYNKQNKFKKSSDERKRDSNNEATAKFCTDAALRTTVGLHNEEDIWYSDSAASYHMSSYKCKFKELRPFVRNIKVADGRYVQSESVGTVRVKIENEESNPVEVVFTDTLYVPELDGNLISIGALTADNMKVVFDDDDLQIINKTTGDILKSKRKQQLYWLVEAQDTPVAMKSATSEVSLLHRRLGHPGKNVMGILTKQLYGKMEVATEQCDTCIKGKMKKQPHNASASSTKRKLQLVHSDIMGPLTPLSLGGSKYLITFLDDYSNYSEVYFLQNKSDALEKFKLYKQKVETKEKIGILRSDNGKEYVNREFEDFLKENGIIHQLTNPYTPQQNGKAERLNQTLMNKTRCLLIDAGMKKEFWAEALNTANHLCNITPSKKLNWKCPWEMWTEVTPDYNNLRIFGSKCWALIPKPVRSSKLDERAKQCVFVGYKEGVKGYKLYDEEKKSFFSGRDVVFDEDNQPTHTSTDATSEGTSFVFHREIHTNNAEPPNVDRETVETENKGTSENEEPTVRRSARIPKHRNCILCCNKCVNENKEPTTLVEALTCEEKEEWKKAINYELECLNKKETWVKVEREADMHTIDTKWIFKKKYDENGQLSEYRARLVARGFQQLPNLEYWDVFSPVIRMGTLRTIIALAVKNQWNIYHVDVASAYLNGDIKEEIYLEIPDTGNTEDDDTRAHYVYRLKKGLYGLKQSGKNWNEKLDEFLKEEGYLRAGTDPCVYYNKERTVIIGVHVDDLVFLCARSIDYDLFLQRMSKVFEVHNLGLVTHLLSMRIRRNQNGDVELDQEMLIDELVQKYNMINANPKAVPIEPGEKFPRETPCCVPVVNDKIPYRQALGALLYISNCTRPDIAHAVNYLCKFNDKYEQKHWEAVKNIIRYLKGTKDLKLIFRSDEKPFEAYTDASWASDPQDRKSVTGGAGCLWRKK